MAKYFDVVVMGMGLGPLATAAFLARRSFRVLVVGQDTPPPMYTFDGLPLLRRPFCFLGATSPVWLHLLSELAQTQLWNRKASLKDPMYQVLGTDLRLDVSSDRERFARAMARTFGGDGRSVDALYDRLATMNGAADAVFERDIVWTPSGFWERRETVHALARLPWMEGAMGLEPLWAGLPVESEWRMFLEAPARHASHAHGALPTLAWARLCGAWSRGVVGLAKGEQELVDFLLDRIVVSGGEVRRTDRIRHIHLKRGAVAGVEIQGDGVATGTQFLVVGGGGAAFSPLVDPSDWGHRKGEFVSCRAGARRYRLSILVRAEGIPESLADESFLLEGASREPLPGLEGAEPLYLHQARGTAPEGHRHLVLEALVPEERVGSFLPTARERLLSRLMGVMPFVERHYVLVDSLADGRPLWDYRSGSRVEVERSLLPKRGAGLGGEVEGMEGQWICPPDAIHPLAGETVRGPFKGTFLVGPQVLPPLGQEGELLAARSVARLITKSDPAKEKMRRDMWKKLDVG